MKSNNKYTIVCEGKTEEKFFISLKTTIFKNRRISQCKEHKSFVIKGTINSRDYIGDNKCCKVFYLIDKDNLAIDEILKHKREIKMRNGENGYLIISNPCIEIILLAIFEDNINVSSLSTKKDLNKKLTEALIKKKIINKNEKYLKSNNDVLKKIIEFLEKNEKYVEEWINNVSKLKIKENKIEFNNFEVVIKFLKGDK